MKHYLAGTILCPAQHTTAAEVRHCEAQRLYDVRGGKWTPPELATALGVASANPEPDVCDDCDCCWEPDCRHGCPRPTCPCWRETEAYR